MAHSTKIRPLSRLIDKASTPFWVIDSGGRLVFLSAAVGDWLNIDPESLVGRSCIAGSSISDDPLDYLAASLAAPPGFSARGTASLNIQPTIPGTRPRRFDPKDARFLRLGQMDDAITLAVAGEFADQAFDPVVDVAVSLREQLDSWRRHHHAVAEGVLLGNSRLATRIQNQVRVAQSVRSDLLILSPPGCCAESLANSIHQHAAPGEPIVTIDGPLMDAELLDASLTLALNHLTDSDQTTATAMIKGIDEMPIEAQLHLVEQLNRFGNRLRLIAIADSDARVADSSTDSANHETLPLHDEERPVGIEVGLADRLCGLSVRLASLADRVEDLPLIVTAMLDRRRAAGEGNADRFARAAIDAMVIFPWPDNFRELDQSIRHAVRNCAGQVIGVENLPLAIRSYRPNQSVPADQQVFDLDQMVASFEADLIRSTLAATKGNRAEAARRLNVSRARLLRKLDTIEGAESP